MKRIFVLAAVTALLMSTSSETAFAAVPTTVPVHGVLHAIGGGAAPDGHYLATFALYETEKGGAAFWSEPNQQVKVAGGRFHYRLGQAKPLATQLIASKKAVFLGVKLGLDPEMPRVRVDAVPFALVADRANGLACTGCVSVKSLKADADLDLGGYALRTAKVTAQSATIGALVAGSIVGDGSKLTGIKVPAGSCPAGQAVVGIDGNGKLQCKQLTSSGPSGSLEKITNGAISNIFNSEFKSDKALPIKDNNPGGSHQSILVPDVGTALSLSVLLELNNSDIGTIKVELKDPKGAKHVLYNGGSKGTKLLATFPNPVKPISGNLGAWVGQNPKGAWLLSVYDTGFKDNQQDGEVVRWTIAVQTLSNSKIQVKGDLVVGGSITAAKSSFPSDPSKCTAANRANLRFDELEGMQVCDGKAWVAALPQPVFWQGTCTHTGSTSWRYFCTNHTTYNTAWRYFDVSKTASGSSTSDQTGRITFKLGGYYRVEFNSVVRSHYRYLELRRNGTVIGEVRQYEGSNANNTLKLSKVVRFDPGDYMNLRMYASHNQNWDGALAISKATKFGRTTWLRVTYVGAHWKIPKCGDKVIDAGEGCDDGNKVDNDDCNNKCIPNITGGVLTGAVNGSPTRTIGTIQGIPGKRIRITKVAICGDSDGSSGPNRFRVSGAGINFTFAAGQSSVSTNHWLGSTPSTGGSARGFVYKSVTYTGSIGQGMTLTWDYHSDWDGRYCNATDEDGKKYADGSSTVRGWVKYQYVLK